VASCHQTLNILAIWTKQPQNHLKLFQSVFRIRDVLIRIRIRKSVVHIRGFGSVSKRLFFDGLEDANNYFTFPSVAQQVIQESQTKLWKSKVLLLILFLLVDGRIRTNKQLRIWIRRPNNYLRVLKIRIRNTGFSKMFGMDK
jgi:hypothetical protein